MSIIYDNFKKQIVGGWEDADELQKVFKELNEKQILMYIRYYENKTVESAIEDDELSRKYIYIIDELKSRIARSHKFNNDDLSDITFHNGKTIRRYEIMRFENHK